VKFNDFQCPACGQSYLQYKPIFAKFEAEHPGAVRYVLKDYPLSSECNANVQNGGPHLAACEAAAAVRLARQHHREEAMIDWLFANQPQLTPPLVRQAAHDVGQVTDFDAKYASTLELVKSDIALGTQLSVRQTPTFFLNGVKIEGALPAQYFDQARHDRHSDAEGARPANRDVQVLILSVGDDQPFDPPFRTEVIRAGPRH